VRSQHIMALTTTAYRYIQVDDQGTPILEGTSMKVVELVTSVKAYGWTPEELLQNYPHITLSKIYSALAYYWDHQSDVDAEIERRDEYVAQLEEEAGTSPLSIKLRAQGLLP
jgi:uncharacterized protein (DUF433 family)